MNPSFTYRFLKSYCCLGLRFYYQQWQVKGKEKIPTQGPLIFIANHQNAFIDAILMTCSGSRNPYYLTRAGVFNKPWAAKLLSILHLKPIYRFRDGFGTLKNNDIILQDCVDLMKKDEVILLFPEANHNEPWSMRDFQKGFARLALMFNSQYPEVPLRIVPFGIHYTEHHGFNARVLLNIGDSLSVNSIIAEGETEREKLDLLVEEAYKAIKALALDLKPESEYHERKQHLINNREYHSDMTKQFDADCKVAAQYPEKSEVKKLYPILSILLLPIQLYVYLTHGLQYWWIKTLIKNKIKDPQFISSVKFALGVFTTPVYYGLISLLFYLITKDSKLTFLFLASLPLSLLTYTKLKRS
jgi:1-acyl-sn-glycerol-3-phosphate acyltransferase